MTAKIVKTKGCKTSKEVLIAVFINDDGKYVIELSAWHCHHKHGYMYQFELIESNDFDLMCRIITDFSETSATDFVNRMIF